MKSRTFRRLMYHLCEALGEAETHSGHKKERIDADSFELHQQLMDQDLHRVFELLAKNSKSPLKTFEDMIFIWSCVCDELLFNPIITLESDDEIDKSYIKNCLIPLLVAPILVISESDGEKADTICYHIKNFLCGNYIANDGPRKNCFYHAAKVYLKKQIKDLRFDFDCTDPITDIIKSIDSIKVNSSLRAITVKHHFRLSRNEVRVNKRIPATTYDEWDSKLDKLETAYIAISAVLYFEKKTHQGINLLRQFKKFHPNLDSYARKFFVALAIANDYHQDDDPKSKVKPLVQWLYENNYFKVPLSQVFELPPLLMDCVTALGEFVYPRSLQSAKISTPWIFNFSAQEVTFKAAKNAQYGKLFHPYIPLINTLHCIQRNELNKALDIIETNYSMHRSRFGFHSYAYAMLRIGLVYKIGKIQHNKLERLLADYNSNVGVNNLHLTDPYSSAMVVSEEDYYKYSIFSSNSPTFHFNISLISALSAYNETAIKLDVSQYYDEYKINKPLSLRPFIEHAQQPNRDILAKLDLVARKLLSGLPYLTDITAPQLFIDTIIEKKILTKKELCDNLITHVKGSKLSVCLLDYTKLIDILSLPGPGGRHDNIIALGENSRVVKLLLDAMHQGCLS